MLGLGAPFGELIELVDVCDGSPYSMLARPLPRADGYTYNTMMQACANARAPRRAAAVLALAEADEAVGDAPDVVSFTTLARAYAAAHKMRWLSVPWARRELSDELSLRYDVRSVPTLIVLEMDTQGREARVVSTDGRTDVAKYAAGYGAPAWLPRAAVAGDGPTPASPSAPQVSPWRRVFG